MNMMNEKWDEMQGKLDLVRVSGEFELSEPEISGFYKYRWKKTWEVNLAIIFCRIIKVEESVTFQNIFSSMTDFRDVVYVSVMPCSPANKAK